jgi:hypothetical protein
LVVIPAGAKLFPWFVIPTGAKLFPWFVIPTEAKLFLGLSSRPKRSCSLVVHPDPSETSEAVSLDVIPAGAKLFPWLSSRPERRDLLFVRGRQPCYTSRRHRQS